MKQITLIFFILLFTTNIKSQNSLSYKLNGYKGNKPILYSIEGSEREILDTAKIQPTGAFVFNNIQKYPAGVYNIYFNDSIYTEIIINKESIILESDVSDIIRNMNVVSSIENKILFDYWKIELKDKNDILMLGLERNAVEQKTYNSHHPRIIEIDSQIAKINIEQKNYIQNLKAKYPSQFAPKLISSYIQPSMEDYNLENKLKPYTSEKDFYFNHFFDNIDFSDSRFIHSKILFTSIGNYISTFGNPASTSNYNKIIDVVMTKAAANDSVYNYCLNLFVKNFANSIWENVFVHLIDNYYINAKNVSPEMVDYYKKISAKIKSLQAGNKLPNIILSDSINKSHNLYKTKGNAKMVIFYSSDCEHCEEAMPSLIDLYNKYKNKKLITFAVAIDDDANLWKTTIKKFNMQWTTVSDLKGMASPLLDEFNISSTPTIFILNNKNIIIAKPNSIDEAETAISQLLK